MNHRLTFELGRYDKIMEWAERLGLTMPMIEERPDGSILMNIDGQIRYIKFAHECDDVAVLRLSIVNDDAIEILKD